MARIESLVQLSTRRVEKPWGRRDLPAPFDGAPAEKPVGEIWFEHEPRDLPLLIKYLFTSERLSVQVHPDDALAAELGFPRGKDEAWIILGAEAGGSLGIGLDPPLSGEELRQAAESGSIESHMIWQPVAAGDAYLSPAGTVHAIGAGLTLIEIQQNVDLTYRLFDYGRPRELHLDAAVRAAQPGLTARACEPRRIGPGRTGIVADRAFVVERWGGAATMKLVSSPEAPLWLMPIAGEVDADGLRLAAGSAWLAQGEASLTLAETADVIAAYLPGKDPVGTGSTER